MILHGLSISLKSQNREILTDTNVIFHDYIPDVIVTDPYNDTLKIDINQDGILDFQFCINYYPAPIPYLLVLNVNCKIGFFMNSNNSDSLLNPLIYWCSGNCYWDYDDYQNKLGVRLTVGADYYYGWVAVTYTRQPPKYVIDSYAFCKIPNYPFLYGQTEISTGTPKNNISDNIKIFTSASGSSLMVESEKQIKSVTITNTNGVIVVDQKNIKSNNAEIGVAGLAHGTYIVKVQFADSKIYTQQIVK